MIPQLFVESIDLGDGRNITIETGRLAKQADGSVLVTSGNNMVLVTVVSNKEAKPDQGFFPLSVEYIEKFYSIGKFQADISSAKVNHQMSLF